MKPKNMDKLVDILSNYMETGDFLYSPKNYQYSFYSDIFIDEIKNGKCLYIDAFLNSLVKNLIARDLNIEIDNGKERTEEQKRYGEFYNMWCSWCFIFDELNKNNLLSK